MVEKGIKWGICHSIYQYPNANNKHIKDYNKKERIVERKGNKQFWDVNNLDGWVIPKKLTVNNFEQIEDTSQFNPIPKQPFLTFTVRRGGTFGPRQKNCYRSWLLYPIPLRLGKTHLWSLTKILTLVMSSKGWRQHIFEDVFINKVFFCLTFKFFFYPKSTAFFE